MSQIAISCWQNIGPTKFFQSSNRWPYVTKIVGRYIAPTPFAYCSCDGPTCWPDVIFSYDGPTNFFLRWADKFISTMGQLDFLTLAYTLAQRLLPIVPAMGQLVGPTLFFNDGPTNFSSDGPTLFESWLVVMISLYKGWQVVGNS